MDKAGKCRDLGLNQMECIKLLKANQNLMRLISDPSDNPLSARIPDLSEIEIDSFNGRYIFPYLFVPEVETETKTFLMINFAQIRPGRNNPGVKSYALNVRFYCHKDIYMYSGGVRALSIFHEIDKSLNNAKITSVGTIKFYDGRHITTNRTYFGYDMIYEIHDFN